jgi:hypothetical protein
MIEITADNCIGLENSLCPPSRAYLEILRNRPDLTVDYIRGWIRTFQSYSISQIRSRGAKQLYRNKALAASIHLYEKPLLNLLSK